MQLNSDLSILDVNEGFIVSNNADNLKHILRPDVNIVHWQRDSIQELDVLLKDINLDVNSPIEYKIDVKNYNVQNLVAFLDEDLKVCVLDKKNLSITKYFRNDIIFLIEKFIQSTLCKNILVKIFSVQHDMCSLFHADFNNLRMLCTYWGPGTEYLRNENVNRAFLGKGLNEKIVIDAQKVLRVSPFDVLVLKGDKWEGNTLGGAVHRSPSIGFNGKRILLKIDFIN